MTGHLICIGGLPGVGKTTIAKRLSEIFTGSVVLDPDEIRLDILDKNPKEDRLRDADITPESTIATIAEMKAQAQAALQQGQTVIIGSAFILASMRKEYKTMAVEQGAKFSAVWLDAGVTIRSARAQARLSDATNPSAVSADKVTEVIIDGEMNWPVVDASHDVEIVYQDVKKVLGL